MSHNIYSVNFKREIRSAIKLSHKPQLGLGEVREQFTGQWEKIIPLMSVFHSPSMVRVQNRIAVGMEVLQYFTMRDWDFKNHNTLSLLKALNKDDQETFFIDNIDVDVVNYMQNTILGSRVYCLKEPLSSMPTARRHNKM